ncbi:MAG: hypothetical protein JF618_14515, partial [Leifsonia sp.]|nr:hypothetical protein [Leifsonia sp.]
MAGLTVALALTGCTGGPAPTASHTAAPTVATATTTPTAPSPAPIALVPGGTAQENLPFFDKVNQATLAANPNAQGRDFID